MKIFNAAQVREWDEYTITQEPILSIELMERAAAACVQWLHQNLDRTSTFIIFCGRGNNGGDGLAIARLLLALQYEVSVYTVKIDEGGAANFKTNLTLLREAGCDVNIITTIKDLPVLRSDMIVIDALLGSGLSRAPEGITAAIIDHINQSPATVIAIDVPSGLYTNKTSKGNTVVKATHTLTFQSYKLAFLVTENNLFVGKLAVLPIGLHPAYENATHADFQLIDEKIIRGIYQPRNSFSHKGTFGHSLLIAGSYGKIGAAVLSARSCLRSGVGLLTVHIPKCGYDIMQMSVPEAMVLTDYNSSYNTKLEEEITKYKSVGIGPGLGIASETGVLLAELLQNYPPALVIDADGLNLLGKRKELLPNIPVHTILTPHPKEFERLFGKPENDFAANTTALQKATELQLIIVLKGHHTFIALPDGRGYFNSTGNAGMATGGSGDVLTGLLTGLLAQGYVPEQAAILGVYLHGRAGDIAAKKYSMEAMTASDIIECFGEAFKVIAM